MTAARWAQIRRVVEDAVLVTPRDRAPWLAAQPLEPDVRADAEQLLAFTQDASQVFAPNSWERFAAPRAIERDLTGELIGNYRLLEEVGRGGMGAVYRAERADGEFEKQVAVKVLQEGIFTAALVRRFREERQILAGLTHPGIAQLLDGGLTADRRPYFVLDFVEGKPIDRYCNSLGLGANAILRLFLSVAEAVQSAHQRLVLHLDLKPANIMVDSAGAPRLLDFGISRLLEDPDASERAGEAEDAPLRAFTPLYASPEQVAGAPLGVASDVFSLGTLLYRLLTGKLPYPLDEGSPEEIARVIQYQPPALPSSLGHPELRGDLDAIMLHALQKDPSARYTTVAAFADDVRRHLNRKPVSVRAHSLRYRAGKFLRRNTAATAVTATAALLLFVSLMALAHAATVARRERAAAEEERATAERRLGDVRQLAHSYIFELSSELEPIPGTVQVRNRVVQRALGYLKAMSQERRADASLDRELASGYFIMGRLQGASYSKSLGDRVGGWDSLNRGLEIQRRMLAAHPNDLDDRVRLVMSLRGLANMKNSEGDTMGAYLMHRESWEVAAPLVEAGVTDARLLQVAESARMVSSSLSGDGVWNLGDPEAGLIWARRADDLLRRYAMLHPDATNDIHYIVALVAARAAAGDALMLLNRPDEALAQYDDVRPLVDREPLAQDSTSLDTRRLVHIRYAGLLLETGRIAEATAYSTVVRPEERKEMAEAGSDIWNTLNHGNEVEWTASIDLYNGRPKLGRAGMNQALKLFREMRVREPDLVWPAISVNFGLLDYADMPTTPVGEAHAMYAEAAQMAEEYAAAHPGVAGARVVVARAHVGLLRTARDAAERRREAAAIHRAVTPVLADHPGHAVARQYLAKAKPYYPCDGSGLC